MIQNIGSKCYNDLNLWEISPRAENDPIKLGSFCFTADFFSPSFYCGNCSKLFIYLDKYFGKLPIIFFLDVHLLKLAKAASELGFQTFFLKFGVSLCIILTHLEICTGSLDNRFKKPLASSFQNTP